MSKLEIAILICVCLLPIVALALVLPKSLKKKKKTPPPTSEYHPEDEKLKPEETQPQTPPVESPIVKDIPKPVTQESEFKDYLKNRRPRGNPSPFMPPRPPFLDDDFFPSNAQAKQNSSEVVDDVDKLSPRLKTLLISGALDTKFDYDEFGNPDKSNDGPNPGEDKKNEDEDKD